MARNCLLAVEAASKGLKRRVQALREPSQAISQGDPEGIHDMRVASRRFRALLKEHQGAFEKKPLKLFRNEMRDITRVLGTARELDVTIAILSSHRKRFHGPPRYAVSYALRQLRAKREAENEGIAKCVQWVNSADFDRRLIAVFEGLGPPSKCIRDHTIQNLKTYYQSLCRLYDLWKSLSSEEILHRIRVRFKQFRYACEIHESLYGERMKAFLGELKSAQEALGSWNDYRILCGYVESVAPNASRTAAEGMPEIMNAFRQNVGRSLQEFETVAQPFFSPEKTQQAFEFINAPETPCCRKKARATRSSAPHP